MDIKTAPQIAIHNKLKLQLASECACYYCLKLFETATIKEWVDNDDTAICPHCGIDAVLPVYKKEDKDLVNLKKIHDYWF